jgi:hypothetical protein
MCLSWSARAHKQTSNIDQQEKLPAGGRHAHSGQLHGIRAVQQGLHAGQGRGSPLGVLAPEQLAGRLPKVADLILHRLALPEFGTHCGQSACQGVHRIALLGACARGGCASALSGRSAPPQPCAACT